VSLVGDGDCFPRRGRRVARGSDDVGRSGDPSSALFLRGRVPVFGIRKCAGGCATPSWCGSKLSLCVVNDQPVGNPKRKVWWV
jgi:hypothetical protein